MGAGLYVVLWGFPMLYHVPWYQSNVSPLSLAHFVYYCFDTTHCSYRLMNSNDLDNLSSDTFDDLVSLQIL